VIRYFYFKIPRSPITNETIIYACRQRVSESIFCHGLMFFFLQDFVFVRMSLQYFNEHKRTNSRSPTQPFDIRLETAVDFPRMQQS
jgi:hypothetical protein